MDFIGLEPEALTAAVQGLDDEALSTEFATIQSRAETLFALGDPTIKEAREAIRLNSVVDAFRAEIARREAEVAEISAQFAAARTAFSAGDGEADADADADEGDEGEADADADADEADADEGDGDEGDGEGEGEGEAVVTASADPIRGRKIQASNIAKAVASKNKSTRKSSGGNVVITAAADVPDFGAGSVLASMADVATAASSRARAFAPYNPAAAQALRDTGVEESIQKAGVASFNLDFAEGTVAKRKEEGYDATKEAVKAHTERVHAGLQSSLSGKPLTAAGWCAPSEVVYNWIADFEVDGLLDLPEVSAPRGGLMITQGPQLAQTTYADLDDFGFGGTEAQAIAGYTKTCETIECPDFEDHRLDFSGYCWKIPILTEAAYPELVADALRLSNVLYAHKMNGRFIADLEALSSATNATGQIGGSVLDTIEALTQVAVKERRWWNVGDNAVMEVKLPQVARHIFKFDMARRSGLALNDVATDQKVAAHFAAHNLSVQYVSDWQERQGAATPTADWPGSLKAMIYPVGTFAKAVKPVINLSAIYDAASLTENEYTGVFFEQGVMTFKRGYRSTVVTVPVCTSGMTGANILMCEEGSA